MTEHEEPTPDYSHLVLIPKIIFKPRHLDETDVPMYETRFSACFDIKADIPEPIEMKDGLIYKIPTGLYLDASQGNRIALQADAIRLKLSIQERSGMAFKGFDVKAGVVDSDYQQEICVLIRKFAVSDGFDTFVGKNVIIPGQRIAQASWELVLVAPGIDTKDVVRLGGFGSTEL